MTPIENYGRLEVIVISCAMTNTKKKPKAKGGNRIRKSRVFKFMAP